MPGVSWIDKLQRKGQKYQSRRHHREDFLGDKRAVFGLLLHGQLYGVVAAKGAGEWAVG